MMRIVRTKTFFNGLRRNVRVNESDVKKSHGGSSHSHSGSPSTSSSSQSGIPANVSGLSSRCVKPTTGPVGRPGASATAEYKVPEYFCYSKISFAEAEVEMAKYRCPQPSALK